MNVSFEHLLPWFMRECISIFWLECVSLGDTNMPVFLVLKGNSSEDAWKQRQCTEWCKHSNHQCASTWKIVQTTRLFHWHTTASVAQFYNIFRNWFLTMNHHILFNHLLNLAFVFQVWMKTIPKSKFGFRVSPTLSSGFLQLCPQTLGYPPSGAERIWVFSSFWQETQESIVVKLEICTIILLLFLFSVFSAVLSSAKETAPACATSMIFPWLFGTLQTDNPHHVLLQATYGCSINIYATEVFI